MWFVKEYERLFFKNKILLRLIFQVSIRNVEFWPTYYQPIFKRFSAACSYIVFSFWKYGARNPTYPFALCQFLALTFWLWSQSRELSARLIPKNTQWTWIDSYTYFQRCEEFTSRFGPKSESGRGRQKLEKCEWVSRVSGPYFWNRKNQGVRCKKSLKIGWGRVGQSSTFLIDTYKIALFCTK